LQQAHLLVKSQLASSNSAVEEAELLNPGISRRASIRCLSDRVSLLELPLTGYLKLVDECQDLNVSFLHRQMLVRIVDNFQRYDTPLFRTMDREQRTQLASLVTIRHVRARDFVFKQGDVGSEFYMIASGTCDVQIQ
jgi:CRP-like cAMP-binding protein